MDTGACTDIDEEHLIDRARDGDESALEQLLRRHQPRLLLMIRARMNPRLKRRVDDCDVLQDAYAEAVKRLPDYLHAPRAPFFLWLRQIVRQKIIDVHRQHLRGQLRDLRREAPIQQSAAASTDCQGLAGRLLGKLTSPSRAAIREETCRQLTVVLESMDWIDREILSLRHLEELNNQEAAVELGIDSSAASKRHLRALRRMEARLVETGLHPGSSSAIRPR